MTTRQVRPAIAALLPRLASYAVTGRFRRRNQTVLTYSKPAQEVIDRLTPARFRRR
jgi:hypothetical protein